MEQQLNDKFYYVYSSSLTNRIQVKIGTLEGIRQKLEYDVLLKDPILKYSGLCQEGCSDLRVECQIFDQNQPLSLPVSTSYKAFTSRWSWNEWLTLPVQFCDLPRTAQLVLTIYDCIGPGKQYAVGGTTISLFSKYGLFREGMIDLRVFVNRKGDGHVKTETPGKTKGVDKDQIQRLTKLIKKHRNGHMTKVDWLDRLLFREWGLVNNDYKCSSDYMFLMIEFPEVIVDSIQHHVVYFEENGEEIHSFRAQTDVVTVPDQEIKQENLVETKHYTLARSLRSNYVDKDAKPNATIRDKLNSIVSYPPTKQLSNKEQDTVWTFRFYLSNQKKALTKFLKCVNWTQQIEVDQALNMMNKWALMDVEDALELLSPNFQHPSVRRYAVSRLRQAPDHDILLYLPQLVQALKYENFQDIQEIYNRLSPNREIQQNIDNNNDKENQLDKRDSRESSSDTIINRSINQQEQLTESNEFDNESRINSLPDNILQNINESTPPSQEQDDNSNSSSKTNTLNNDQDLATFLIQRTSKNSTLANYFYWYLLIECEDQEPTIKQNIAVREMYLTVMKAFSQTLARGDLEMQKRRTMLTMQQKFIDNLVKLVKTVLRESGNRKKKTEKLQQLLSDPAIFKFNFTNFEPIPFPLDPEIIIKGIIAEKASLFKSALMPSKLHFLTTNNVEYVAIFKHGDDLRQDQLILQMIQLMDNVLRKENLDLKLTPYRVLATSTKHGFVQFIDSVSVAEAVAAEGSIHNYFRKYHPLENGPYGIAPDIMDTYVRSCAGYCVITYLLGVGDRHLDNLLLTTCGKLFHIDFGYILGRDPKPLPPSMKLSKEMVEAMGGVNSEHYQEFRKQCYTAFLHLRRHANLMLNLFSLMVDASVPDIALEPDKAVKKVQDKFRLESSEEEAVQYIQCLIDSSVTAVMPAIVEQIHKITQYIRK